MVINLIVCASVATSTLDKFDFLMEVGAMGELPIARIETKREVKALLQPTGMTVQRPG